ncbi:MAG: PLP-dependent aminotransferase family protein [Acidimicrobiales bacterium]
MSFDMTARFCADLPAPEPRWQQPPRYSFVGGHNDAASVPFTGLAEAAVAALRREGPALATYNLGGSPQGYEPLRSFIAEGLRARAGLADDAESVLITSGSLQALDLVNGLLLEPGDTVMVEQATYGGMLSRLARLGVRVLGAALDAEGIIPERLDAQLQELAAAGVAPKYFYTIPTVQNPTGSVMPLPRRLALLEVCRRHDLAIFEDDCYADLRWSGNRPPALRALDQQHRAGAPGGSVSAGSGSAGPGSGSPGSGGLESGGRGSGGSGSGGGQVIYCGSFSKSIAPALRVGYIVADWPVLSAMMALKTDAGSGALEQLVVADYAAAHFDDHVARLSEVLRAKCEVMCDAVRTSFGADAVFDEPQGGIFLWLTLPEGTDTSVLAGPALAAGVEFNPGAGWSADPQWGRRRLRLCFGHPDHQTIRDGVAVLAEVYRAHR